MKYQEWLTEEKLLQVEGWARDGLTNEQIANMIGINKVTLYEWIKQFPNFANALKKGKDVVDREVENAVIKASCGYYVTERTEYREVDKETGEEVLERVTENTKWIPPNVTACIFWLKNRKPEAYRDKHDVDVGNPVPIVFIDDVG